MNKKSAVLIIEDDAEDREILAAIFNELDYSNEILFFICAQDVISYLKRYGVQPFIILSDINLPKVDGFELRKIMQNNDNPNSHCVPFIFFSTGTNPQTILSAYASSVQGFFLKPSKYEHIKKTITIIMDYWLECYYPNCGTA